MTAAPVFLVVGTGSIARRHMGNLRTLFPDAVVACVSASGRPLQAGELGEGVEVFASLAVALARRPQFAVVASPAPAHLAQAATLLEAGVPVLVEKPLADSLATFTTYASVLRAHRDRLEVGYNLRYLPSAQALQDALQAERIGRLHAVFVEAGQYLPDWRPGSDYRRGVSAQRVLGGGALLELSHELDYLRWLFGDFDKAYCVIATSGTLDLDVEDRVDALLTRSDGLVAHVHLDFLQRTPSRSCRIIGEHGTLHWNLIDNNLVLHGPGGSEETLLRDPGFDRNAMYLEELARFARVARGELSPAVDLEQGVAVMALVEALRQSAQLGLAVPIGAISA